MLSCLPYQCMSFQFDPKAGSKEQGRKCDAHKALIWEFRSSLNNFYFFLEGNNDDQKSRQFTLWRICISMAVGEVGIDVFVNHSILIIYDVNK